MSRRYCGLGVVIGFPGVGCALTAQLVGAQRTVARRARYLRQTVGLLVGRYHRFSKRRLGCCVGVGFPQRIRNETGVVLLYLQAGVTNNNR